MFVIILDDRKHLDTDEKTTSVVDNILRIIFSIGFSAVLAT